MSLLYLRKNITVTPLRSRTEAIVKIPTPTHSETEQKLLWSCKLSSIILSGPTNTAKTNNSMLTRKGIPFQWGKEQEEAF